MAAQSRTFAHWNRNLLLASCDWPGMLADFGEAWAEEQQHVLSPPLNKET